MSVPQQAPIIQWKGGGQTALYPLCRPHMWGALSSLPVQRGPVFNLTFPSGSYLSSAHSELVAVSNPSVQITFLKVVHYPYIHTHKATLWGFFCSTLDFALTSMYEFRMLPIMHLHASYICNRYYVIKPNCWLFFLQVSPGFCHVNKCECTIMLVISWGLYISTC